MCGIAGIYRVWGEADDAAIVRRMLARLVRRGPDAEGLAVEQRAVLGHRRLAILDLSDAGRQPMVSADGRFVVTLNGEIYNYRDLALELGLGPESLRSRSDTEVLLHAWMRWGSDALERMAGQWAFAMYDRRTERLTLARDRFGEKPLYYSHDAGRLAFTSSLEALLEDPAVERRLDPYALAEYVTLRYVVSPRTVLASVKKLEGGHLLELGSDGAVVERTWYQPPFRSHSAPRGKTSTSHFGELLERSVARCLTSDRPVGLLLSDGIDSNALLAALPDSSPDVTCFTFRLRDGERCEVPAAIDARGHELVSVDTSRAELAAHFDEYCAGLTEPVGDVAALATWTLIRSARPRVTVFLCGHGGDEVLGGYRLSQNLFRLELLRRSALLPAAWTRGAMRRHLNGAESLDARRGRLRGASAAQGPGAARFLIDRPLPANQVNALTGGFSADKGVYLATIDRFYGECDQGTTAVDRIQNVLVRTFLSANILSWADSVAMSSSAELRMPYLDRDLVAFVANLPAGYRVPAWPGKANTKRVLRDWARHRLPLDVVKRSKKGFQGGSVGGLLRAIPGTARARVLESPALRRALPGLEAWMETVPEDGAGGSGPALWALLVLATWCVARDIVM